MKCFFLLDVRPIKKSSPQALFLLGVHLGSKLLWFAELTRSERCLAAKKREEEGNTVPSKEGGVRKYADLTPTFC